MSRIDRRSILKLFGVGAVVAPVVAGKVLDLTEKALILEPPKVEIIQAPRVEVCQTGFPTDVIKDISLTVRFKSGRRWQMTCDEAKIEESIINSHALNVTTLEDMAKSPFMKTTMTHEYECSVRLRGNYPVTITE